MPAAYLPARVSVAALVLTSCPATLLWAVITRELVAKNLRLLAISALPSSDRDGIEPPCRSIGPAWPPGIHRSATSAPSSVHRLADLSSSRAFTFLPILSDITPACPPGPTSFRVADAPAAQLNEI